MSDEELALAWRATAAKWWRVVKQLETVKNAGTNPCEMCEYMDKHKPTATLVCAACPAHDLCHSTDAPYRVWYDAMEEAYEAALYIARCCDEEAEELEQ